MNTLLIITVAVLNANLAAQASPPPRPANVVTAIGVGYPPRHMRGAQARLMARRAGEVVAARNLAVRLGLPNGARLGPFRYVSYRELPKGGVEVTVEALVIVRRPPPRAPHGP